MRWTIRNTGRLVETLRNQFQDVVEHLYERAARLSLAFESLPSFFRDRLVNHPRRSPPDTRHRPFALTSKVNHLVESLFRTLATSLSDLVTTHRVLIKGSFDTDGYETQPQPTASGQQFELTFSLLNRVPRSCNGYSVCIE